MTKNEDFKALEAIKNYCIDCKKREAQNVEECGIEECWLRPFRLGNNPYSQQAEEADEI